MHLKLVVVVAVACLAVSLVEARSYKALLQEFLREEQRMPTEVDVIDVWNKQVKGCGINEEEEKAILGKIKEFMDENENKLKDIEDSLEEAVVKEKIPYDEHKKLEEIDRPVEEAKEGNPKVKCLIEKVEEEVGKRMEEGLKDCDKLDSLVTDKRATEECKQDFFKALKDDVKCVEDKVKEVEQTKRGNAKEGKKPDKVKQVLKWVEYQAKKIAYKHAVETFENFCEVKSESEEHNGNGDSSSEVVKEKNVRELLSLVLKELKNRK